MSRNLPRRFSRSTQKKFNSLRTANSVLFGDGAAGALLSGDSGTGKSNAMQVLAQHLILADCGMTFISPHGDDPEDIERFCASLPPSKRRKVIVIRYADTNRIAGMNPLYVNQRGLDNVTFRARIASRVGHVSKILLHAFGEKDFNGKPLMFKYFNYYLMTLAVTGLTIPDVRHFFDTSSAVYQALVRYAPDFVAQLELEQLADLRPVDREELIGSTKNRFLNFLRNPIVELALGKPDGHIDLQQAIRDRAIIIVNLDRGGVLRDEDVEIFANLWLHEVLYAVYNTPRAERVPHFLMIDELPTFRSSFEVITSALAQVRKFQARFVVAFQGTQLFEERQQDRLLNALVGQCNSHFYFRHKNPADAKYFGEIIRLPSIDTKKEKHVLSQQQQYQDGHDIVTLSDESESFSDAEQDGGSESNATSNTETSTQGTSASSGTSTSSGKSDSTSRLAEAVHQARTEQSGRSEQNGRSNQSGSSSSSGVSQGKTATNGISWSKTKTRGVSITRKQSLVPRILTREVVTTVQFYTTEEQFIEAARDLTNLSRGTCLLYLAGQGVSQIQIPLASHPLIKLPRSAARKLAQLRLEVLSRPEFDTTENLQRKRLEFEQDLIRFLNQINQPAGLIGSAEPELILPPTTHDNNLITI